MTRPILMLLGLASFLLAEVLRGSAVSVTWQANPEADVSRDEVEWVTVPMTPETAATDGLTMEVDGLMAGSVYQFRLRAINTSGMRSGWSDSSAYTVPTSQRLRIVIYSSDSPSRDNKREEASFFQPVDGPRRFWWAEIETP